MATVRWAVGRGHGAVVLHLRGSYDLDAAQNVDSTHTLQPVQHACIVGIIVCSCTCSDRLCIDYIYNRESRCTAVKNVFSVSAIIYFSESYIAIIPRFR